MWYELLCTDSKKTLNFIFFVVWGFLQYKSFHTISFVFTNVTDFFLKKSRYKILTNIISAHCYAMSFIVKKYSWGAFIIFSFRLLFISLCFIWLIMRKIYIFILIFRKFILWNGVRYSIHHPTGCTGCCPNDIGITSVNSESRFHP